MATGGDSARFYRFAGLAVAIAMWAAGVAVQVPPRLMSAFELQDAEKFIEATVIAGSTPMR
jgi:hypothetical protein